MRRLGQNIERGAGARLALRVTPARPRRGGRRRPAGGRSMIVIDPMSGVRQSFRITPRNGILYRAGLAGHASARRLSTAPTPRGCAGSGSVTGHFLGRRPYGTHRASPGPTAAAVSGLGFPCGSSRQAGAAGSLRSSPATKLMSPPRRVSSRTDLGAGRWAGYLPAGQAALAAPRAVGSLICREAWRHA